MYTDHRYPFILVDKIIENIPSKKIVAIKNISFNETIFKKLKNLNYIYPSSYLIEVISQCAQIMSVAEGITAKIDNFKIFANAIPGDQVRVVVIKENIINDFHIYSGNAYIGDKLIIKGEITGRAFTVSS